MSVEVVSLGCRLNLAERNRLRGLLAGSAAVTATPTRIESGLLA